MHILLTIIAFLVIFSAIILIHELGHFVSAKKSGVKVEEFGIGLPPRIFGKKFGETIYSVNWIPFGGFVRMWGEDARNTKLINNKRTFIGQPVLNRIIIVTAGVIMNFVLAWLLLTIGFSVGMKPLLLEDDVLNAVNDGQIVLEKVVFSEALDEESEKDLVPFPHPQIYRISEDSSLYEAGYRDGDIIDIYNDNYIFGLDGFEKSFNESPDQIRVVVTEVLADTPAQRSGIKEGDIVVSAQGGDVDDVVELIETTEGCQSEACSYTIDRNGELIDYEILPEQGRIGVMLSELRGYDEGKLLLQNSSLLYSIAEIKEEKYPVHVAMGKSVTEIVRLGKVTLLMFGDFVGELFRDGKVPESVAGPVGIAHMTSYFVTEGIVSLLRFAAILSLSLGVINILPFPGLDGGRLLFIIVELIIGRRVSPKWENSIHGLGYLLLLVLIFAVTYSDIMRLVVGR